MKRAYNYTTIFVCDLFTDKYEIFCINPQPYGTVKIKAKDLFTGEEIEIITGRTYANHLHLKKFGVQIEKNVHFF